MNINKRGSKMAYYVVKGVVFLKKEEALAYKEK